MGESRRPGGSTTEAIISTSEEGIDGWHEPRVVARLERRVGWFRPVSREDLPGK